MSSDVWQAKTKIGVQLETSSGKTPLGFVFCGDNESVHDVLNDKRPYLLFQTAPQSTEMVNKHSIMRVEVVDHHSREMELSSDQGERGAVRLTYANGAEVVGEVAPGPGQRVSDIINQDRKFFLFLPAEGTVNYVSTAFLSRVLISDVADA